MRTRNSSHRYGCVRTGGACLAEYGDGMYYRARLMEFSSLDPVRIMVQHVDYGSDDILPTNK